MCNETPQAVPKGSGTPETASALDRGNHPESH